MINRKLLKNFDTITIVIVLILVVIGTVAISSATHVHETKDFSTVQKHIAWTVLAIGLLLLIISVDYNNFASVVVYLYIGGILLLLAVLFFGTEIKGAKSWFTFGTLGSIQPSEFVKVIVIITFSKHVEKIKESDANAINKPKNLLVLCVHMLIPILLIMKQPDWGTAAVFIGIMVTILFAAGISYKYIFTAFGVAAVSLPLLFFYVMEDYQRKRLLVFLDPNRDPLDSGYHVIQSKIAVGSGQLYGKGLFKGTQTQMGYLPEQDTDFIFSVIGEELGFIWCSVIIVLFVTLLLRFLYLASIAKDDFGSYIIIGVTAMLFFHILVNIGMTIGLAPITGIPLPFISRGGSSMLTNMAAVGLVLNVAMRRQKINF